MIRLLLTLAMIGSIASAEMEFTGQIFRRGESYFITKNYSSVEPSYRLRWRKRSRLHRICLADVRASCPRYRVQFLRATRIRGVTEFVDAALPKRVN